MKAWLIYEKKYDLFRCPECNEFLEYVNPKDCVNTTATRSKDFYARNLHVDIEKIDGIFNRILETGDRFYCTSCDKTWSPIGRGIEI